MRFLVLLIIVVLAASGGGATKPVTDLIPSTPDAAALLIAEANLESANNTISGYFTLHGSYDGMTIDQLRQLDPGLDQTMAAPPPAPPFCWKDGWGTSTASRRGPGGSPQAGPC